MRITMLLRAAAAGLTCIALVATPWPANADTYTGKDPAGDVGEIEYGGTRAQGPSQSAGRRANGDLTQIRVTHGSTTVRILMKFRDLRRSSPKHTYSVSVRTPKATWGLNFEAGPGGYRVPAGSPWKPGALFIQRIATDGMMTNPSCDSVRKIDYGNNTALLVVPRRCLERPVWVRATAQVSTGVNQYSAYVDYAMMRGVKGGARYSPRVFQ